MKWKKEIGFYRRGLRLPPPPPLLHSNASFAQSQHWTLYSVFCATEAHMDPGFAGPHTEGFIIYEPWSQASPSCDDRFSVQE